MFEVGFTEIILILGIALVVLGPEKLPKVAADIGRWVGRARAMARQFKAQLDEEVVKVDSGWTQPKPAPRSKPSPATRDSEAAPATGSPPAGVPATAAPEADAAAGPSTPPAGPAEPARPAGEADSP